MFGDIVKVTPTSKVVGDLALMMITGNLSAEDVMNPDKEIAFPGSVISFFNGELGQPPGGFPKALQEKVLKGETPITVRPGSVMPPVDLDAARKEAQQKIGRNISNQELGSYLMYPDVFVDFARHLRSFSQVTNVPTRAFFFGMEPGEEIAIEIERGKTLILRFLALGDVDEDGIRTVFFELNGQPRSVRIEDKNQEATRPQARQAEDGNPDHVPAPMPGTVAGIVVEKGKKVLRGDTLLSLEAMKMETAVTAERDGVVDEVVVTVGAQVNAKDLLIVFESE